MVLLVRLVPKAGPARNSSLLSTKGGARLGCSFQTLPLPLPLMGLVSCSKAWAYFNTPEVCSMFSNEMYFYSGSKFSECLHVRQCAGLVKGLMLLLQGIVGPRCQDCLLRPSEAWVEGASSLPTTSSQPVRSY